jgi:hypothetical protein
LKDQIYGQGMNTLDELKAWVIEAIADVIMDMLQRVCQEVDYRWDVHRITDGAHHEVFCN